MCNIYLDDDRCTVSQVVRQTNSQSARVSLFSQESQESPAKTTNRNAVRPSASVTSPIFGWRTMTVKLRTSRSSSDNMSCSCSWGETEFGVPPPSGNLTYLLNIVIHCGWNNWTLWFSIVKKELERVWTPNILSMTILGKQIGATLQ